MSQLSYALNLLKGLPGSLADARESLISSLAAAVGIPMGYAVMKMYGKQNQCRLPLANKVVITDSAGTFTAGSIVTTINGTAITTAFGTDKDTTMTAHAAAILAGISDALSAVYSSSGHTITVILKNTAIATSVTSVAGITGTMTISTEVISSADSASNFLGVAVNNGTRVQTSAGVTDYAANDVVPVLEEGALFVLPEETVTSDDSVYLRIVTNGAKLPGMFGKSADSGKCVIIPGARWVEGGTTTTVAKLQLNLPQ